jgi:hypothetical protein
MSSIRLPPRHVEKRRPADAMPSGSVFDRDAGFLGQFGHIEEVLQ